MWSFGPLVYFLRCQSQWVYLTKANQRLPMQTPNSALIHNTVPISHYSAWLRSSSCLVQIVHVALVRFRRANSISAMFHSINVLRPIVRQPVFEGESRHTLNLCVWTELRCLWLCSVNWPWRSCGSFVVASHPLPRPPGIATGSYSSPSSRLCQTSGYQCDRTGDSSGCCCCRLPASVSHRYR